MLRKFWERFPDAEAPLRRWYKTALQARWTDLQDVRRIFPAADGVTTSTGDTLTVFNIRGNNYRLVVRIRYDYELINIRAVLTHEEYDEEKWKE